MTVRVYSAGMLVEEVVCQSQEQVEKVAAYWQDEGFRVRVS